MLVVSCLLGMEVSLLQRLCEAHPSSSVKLTIQYRMNSEIMGVCNTLIYDNKLTCGNGDVSERKLVLDDTTPYITEWLKEVLHPDRGVVFVNTDIISGKDIR